MPYERVWIPDLQQWKIIGELTGEEALALYATIPAGMTQWGWGARSGTFAYGTTTDSLIKTYTSPPPDVERSLIQREKTYVPPDIPDDYKRYWSSVGTLPVTVNGETSKDDNGNIIAIGITTILLIWSMGGIKHGKKKSSSKQTA